VVTVICGCTVFLDGGNSVQNILTNSGINQTVSQASGAAAGAAVSLTIKTAENMATKKEPEDDKK